MENEIKEISADELKKLIQKLVNKEFESNGKINKSYRNNELYFNDKSSSRNSSNHDQIAIKIKINNDKNYYININLIEYYDNKYNKQLQCNLNDPKQNQSISNTNKQFIFESKNYNPNDICKIIRIVDKIIKKINEDKNIDKYDENIENFLKNYEEELNNPNHSNNIKNIILYGPPGVGKTYSTKKLISMIESGISIYNIFKTISKSSCNEYYDSYYPEEKRVKFITFHQSYSYEEFIEGLRPQKDNSVEPEDGVFKKFCKLAEESPDENFYFIIDEINRGNISKIFGELITLIEEDKRCTYSVELPYSKSEEDPFSVPSNLYIIGTMNSTDKSIALIDTALRRRFTFVKIEPNPGLLVDNNDARELMESLNEKIREKLGEDYLIGHSYFMNINKDGDKNEIDKELEFIKKYKLRPLLEEYFYNDKSSYDEMVQILKIKDETNLN